MSSGPILCPSLRGTVQHGAMQGVCEGSDGVLIDAGQAKKSAGRWVREWKVRHEALLRGLEQT